MTIAPVRSAVLKDPWLIGVSAHHGSHRQLLDSWVARDIDVTAAVGAIVVPAARPVDCLREVMSLARTFGCPLVVLCSKSASAAQAADLGAATGTDVIAVDVRRPVTIPLLATDRLLATERKVGASDLSLKRNIGLLLGILTGWESILFLDDDICAVDAADLPRAAALVSKYRAVGLRNVGYPDNSVVCHAYRAVGYAQDTFIGGGAMLTSPRHTLSFFPNIYNEDWFFLLGNGLPFRVAESGVARQRSFDPFATPARAAAEEFGDTLAEGLFSLLDQERNLADANAAAFWGDFLYRRRGLLDEVLRRAEIAVEDPALRRRIRASLRAAQGASAEINANLCQRYVQAWMNDLDLWGDYVASVAPTGDVFKALAKLGLLFNTYRSLR